MVLGNPWKAFTGQMINIDQSYSIPGSRIADSLAFIRNTAKNIRDHHVSIPLVSFDKEMALHCILHMFMPRVL